MIAFVGWGLIGLFFAFRTSERYSWLSEVAFSIFVIGWISSLAWIARLMQKLTCAERLARIDELTGVANRRGLLDELNAAIQRAGSEDHVLLLAMLDCDGFKRLNDQLGHPSGDKTLRQIAKILSDCATPDVFVSRIGGDEFCLIFSRMDLETSRLIIEEMRTALQNQIRDVCPGLTYSIGLVAIPTLKGTGPGGLDPLECLKQADRVMYAAKNDGGNCIRCETIDRVSVSEKTGTDC